MPRPWNHTLRIKHLLTQEDTPEAVSESMRAVAAVIKRSRFMADFAENWPEIAEMDDCGEANDMLDAMYDYCDERRIWVA